MDCKSTIMAVFVSSALVSTGCSSTADNHGHLKGWRERNAPDVWHEPTTDQRESASPRYTEEFRAIMAAANAGGVRSGVDSEEAECVGSWAYSSGMYHSCVAIFRVREGYALLTYSAVTARETGERGVFRPNPIHRLRRSSANRLSLRHRRSLRRRRRRFRTARKGRQWMT